MLVARKPFVAQLDYFDIVTDPHIRFPTFCIIVRSPVHHLKFPGYSVNGVKKAVVSWILRNALYQPILHWLKDYIEEIFFNIAIARNKFS